MWQRNFVGGLFVAGKLFGGDAPLQGHFVGGLFVPGRFVGGRFVAAPIYIIYQTIYRWFLEPQRVFVVLSNL